MKIFDKNTGEILNPEDQAKNVIDYFVLEKNNSLKNDHWIIVEKLKKD